MSEPIIEREPTDSRAKRMNPLLKFVLEMGPLLIFFYATLRGESLTAALPVLGELGRPLFVATGLFMVATVISLTISWAMTRTIPMMPLVSGVVVLVFGGLSIWLQNDTFIKMKPTIIYVLFGGILLGGLYFNKPLLSIVFDSMFDLTEEGWRKLTVRWALFFFVLAAINEVAWRSFSTDTWIASKMFVSFPATMVFAFLQIPLLKRHWVGDDNPFA